MTPAPPGLIPAHPALVPADTPDDIRDHRPSAASLLAWVARTPELPWHYDGRHPDLFEPHLEAIITALFAQPGGSAGGLQLFCVEALDGASYNYRALVAVDGDEHPVQVPIDRITEQIVVRSMIDRARRGVSRPAPERGGLGI